MSQWPTFIAQTAGSRTVGYPSIDVDADKQKPYGYKEKPRKKVYGFCTNKFCRSAKVGKQDGRYLIDSHTGFAQLITSDQAKSSCEYCDYALYWTRTYTYYTNAELEEKGLKVKFRYR